MHAHSLKSKHREKAKNA